MAETGESTSVVKEKNQTKKLTVIIAAALVCFIAIFTAVKVYTSPARQLQRQLDLGRRYLEEMDYEQAIVAFEQAIEIDPMNADAYLGKADAYVGLGDTKTAVAVLEEGYELTQSNEILKRLEELRGSGDEAANAETDGDVAEETAVGESGLPYFELGFSPEDFRVAGYSLMDGDHFADVEAAAAGTLPEFGGTLSPDYQPGWTYERQNDYLFLNYQDENHEWAQVVYYVFTETLRSICMRVGTEVIPDTECPLYEGKVTPGVTSGEEALESLGIGPLIQAVEEKADGERLEFESQYGRGECVKYSPYAYSEYAYDISCHADEQWDIRIGFRDNMVSFVEVWKFK